MNNKYKVMLGAVAGAALGAAAVQGLHAQVKPKAYLNLVPKGARA